MTTWTSGAIAAALAFALPAFATASGELPRHGVLGAALVDSKGAVSVRATIPGGAAERAGLQPGDVVTTLDGAPVLSPGDAVRRVQLTPSGTTVRLGIVRGGVAQTVAVVLGQPPDERDPAVRTIYGALEIDHTLRRTLLDVPVNAAGRRPAVLLVGGIGCYSVDAAGNADDAYLRIARDMSKAGFVTMRLEKSGVGDSRGAACPTVDFRAESASYGAALAALRADSRVDADRVYLLGHSIGTLIAPRLALEQHVRGVIVAEAVARPWFEYELENLRRQLVLGGDAPDVVDAKLALKERCMHRYLIAGEDEALIERDEPACKEHNTIYPVEAPYMRQVAALNAIDPWTRIDVPVLAIDGASDFVVAEADHRRIVDVVNRAHPGAATLSIIDGMDHNLSASSSAAVFYANSERGVRAPYNTRFSGVVVGWLCKHERCGATVAAAASAAPSERSLPFTLVDNRPFVAVRVDGRDLRFLVDTGAAGHNAMSSRVAAALHLSRRGAAALDGANAGRLATSEAVVGRFELGPLTLRGATFTVADFSKLERRIGFRLDGIVAAETLAAHRIRFDYVRRIMTVDAADALAGATALPMRVEGGWPIVAASVDGVRGEFLIDTGDRSYLTLFTPFARAHYPEAKRPLRGVVTGFGLVAPIVTDLTRTRLELGSLVVPDMLTRLATQTAGGFASTTLAGTIGSATLTHGVVEFDYPAAVLRMARFVPAPRSEWDRAGMWLSRGDGTIDVDDVLAGGPAATAGVRAGDRIAAVDGRAAASVDVPALRAHLGSAGAGVVHLTLRREGRDIAVTVRTRPLL